MNLQIWITQAHENWKEHNPAYFKDLVRSGDLEMALREAAERTHEDMSDLEAQGYSYQEAWEMTREKYLFRPTEPVADDEVSEGVRLSREINALHNQILQSMNEISIGLEESDQKTKDDQSKPVC